MAFEAILNELRKCWTVFFKLFSILFTAAGPRHHRWRQEDEPAVEESEPLHRRHSRILDWLGEDLQFKVASSMAAAYTLLFLKIVVSSSPSLVKKTD
ncbi:hypothetical protein GQ600_1629 [Phytophthora cactorum]|nr:hypothetical protein GQ600_1629 [Phytophthora cactorum]